jgi:ferredoxin-NADP reductase
MRQLTVADRRLIAENIVELTLRDPVGRLLPTWTPGAHIDVSIAPQLVRQYSLCGAPDDCATYRIAVLREPEGRGGSRVVHDKLHVGSVVEVGQPRNNFALEPAESYLFIAGGIGITPIIPMINQVSETPTRWQLLYGGRRRGSMAYVTELERWGEAVTIRPQDRYGLLDIQQEIAGCSRDTLIYTCGPGPLLEAVEGCCTATDRRESLRLERFQATDVDSAEHRQEFTVELGHSGQALIVAPSRSILEVLQDAGIDVLSSCEEGICGSCELPVLSGTPDHRDSVLSDEEQAAGDKMMICVSRSRSPRLRLDIEPADSQVWSSGRRCE